MYAAFNNNNKAKTSRYRHARYKEERIWIIILDLGTTGGEWSASRPGRALRLGKGTLYMHCTGGWVGPRADLGTEVRGKILLPLPGIESRRPDVESVVRHNID
jgi:hypothetical protein